MNNPITQAHEDYMGYIIRYGIAEAAIILEDYRNVIHAEGLDEDDWERKYIEAAASIISARQPQEAQQEAPAAPQANPITAAILGAIAAPAPAHTITVSWANGARATYSAAMLDTLKADPAALDIQDDDTGEIIYIQPAPATEAAPVPICTIALSEGEGRQTINWSPADGLLYSDACEEPCNGYSYSDAAEAMDAACYMWSDPAWELEII